MIMNKRNIFMASAFLLVFFLLLMNIEGVSAQEAGNSLDTAQMVEMPGEFSGALYVENEADFYKFSFEENEHIEITFNSKAPNDGHRLNSIIPTEMKSSALSRAMEQLKRVISC